jgi:hypothetical protein
MASTPPTGKPIRSPSYPSSSLGEAITHVRKIEALYRLGPVDRVAGAKLIGYAGLSGPANQALASLAQYGLVERAGKGEMRVTERARAILHPNSDEEKRQGLQTAAFEPQLFRELHERWPSMIPPEDGVVTYLNRQGFNQSAIRPAAKAYLQTLAFLEEANASISNGPEEVGGTDDPGNEPEIIVEQPQPPLSRPPLMASPTPAVTVGYANDGLPLNKINMNIQGDVVHLSATLDFRGLTMLEKKIASLKALMEPDETEDDKTDDEILG